MTLSSRLFGLSLLLLPAALAIAALAQGCGGDSGGASSSGEPAGELGAPCAKAEDCASGLCLPVGRCTDPCQTFTDCPDTPDWLCEPEDGLGRVCTCTPTDPLGLADGGAQGAEACDGRDNDCDGVVDNDAHCPEPGTVCQKGACVCPADHLCDGICRDFETDQDHCGGCGKQCPDPPHAFGACAQAKCSFACIYDFYGDCDGDAANGCEAYMLEDANHCGTCDRACHEGACSSGLCEPTVLLSALSAVGAVAVDDTYVYVTQNDVCVRRFLKADGSAETDLSGGLTNDCLELAVGPGNVYGTNYDGMYSYDMQAAELGRLLGFFRSPVADGDELFVIKAQGGVLHAGADLAAPETILPADIAVGYLAVDATDVYALYNTNDDMNGVLARVPRAGGAVETLLAPVAAMSSVGVDAENVYYGSNGTLYAISKAGGAAPKALMTKFLSCVVPDALGIYVIDVDLKVRRVDPKTGHSLVVAQAYDKLLCPAVDASHLYIGNPAGSVERAEK